MAEAGLIESEGKSTTSRIAITTGLTRKDVAKLRTTTQENSLSSVRYSRGVRVIKGWTSDPDYLTQNGDPKVLPLHGSTVSFESLVSRYSGDMPYRAMLQELQQSQLVNLREDEALELLSDTYIPKGDESEKLSILGRDVGLLISTIDHNLNPAFEPTYYFQRKVCYDNLPREAVELFKKMVNKDSMALLVKFNDWLAEHDGDDQSNTDVNDKVLAGVGIYYFEESAKVATLKREGL